MIEVPRPPVPTADELEVMLRERYSIPSYTTLQSVLDEALDALQTIAAWPETEGAAERMRAEARATLASFQLRG